MIGVAPAPSLSALVGLFGSAAPDDRRLAEPWLGRSHSAIWYARASWGLEAIARWFRATSPAASQRIWVPDYFCNEPLGPLRDLGAPLVFYPITASLEPDWKACADLAVPSPPGLFVLVHYFGKAADAAAAQDFCRRHGALLIEDGTHVLHPGDGVGAHGDFAIYSPYKHLAIPDGGLLTVADPVVARELRADPARFRGADGAAMQWLVRKIVRLAVPARLLGAVLRVGQTRFSAEPPPRALVPAGLSRLARKMIAHPEWSLAAVAARRTAAWEALHAVAWPNGVRALFTPSQAGMAPYRFVLDCGDRAAAERLFDELLAAGCPVESWPDLPPEILGDPVRHARPVALRYRLLFLPVHQSLDIPELVAACQIACRRFTAWPIP